VDQIKGSRQGPHLKIGLNNAENAWITNLNTDSYDLAALRTWQHLQGEGEVPAQTGSADLAVERGDLEPEITVDLRLDDLQIEVVEAP
jgi:hypothetical protein